MNERQRDIETGILRAVGKLVIIIILLGIFLLASGAIVDALRTP